MYVEYLPGEKHSKTNADTSDDINAFNDAGYVLTKDDLIIDIDELDKKIIKEMLKRFEIKTQVVWTDRGVHLYFLKPQGFRGARAKTALGFEAEYKHQSNTRSITIKRNGVRREIENIGVRSPVPDYLMPHRKCEELLGMDDGDGRNQALFNHRMKIANIKDWKKCLFFINEYIFAEPLPDDEMEELTRDSVRPEATKDGEGIIADAIMTDRHVVKYAHHIYFKEGHEYKSDEEELNRIAYQYAPGQKTRYIDEIVKQMDYRGKPIPEGQVFDIRLANGILRNGKFIEVNYTDFTPFSIDIPYEPDMESVKQIDDYLDMLTNNDENYKRHMLEALGHTLIVNKEVKRLLGKFFIFVGDGGNGKGTLLAIIRKILHEKNCGSLSIQNMSDERYLNSLQGKLANLGDDIQDEPINNEQMKILKNISTCDFIALRKLYSDSVSAELTPTLIFTSNHILKSFEKGESYKRRVEWLPMYNKPKHKSGTFISEVTTDVALKYWLKLIVEGYMRLYKNKAFTPSKSIEDFNAEYHEENNTALEYIINLKQSEVINKHSPEVYEEYKNWCEENGVNEQSMKLFKETLQDKLHVVLKQKKINGKNQKIYLASN